MVINFKTYKSSRDTRKLTQILILIIIIKHNYPKLAPIKVIQSRANRPLSDTAITLLGKPQKESINFR